MCDNEKTKLLLEAWKEIVNVQMHFNEIEMKIRGMAITTLTAFIGAIGFILKNNKAINIQNILLQDNKFLNVILIIGASIWFAFYFMDRYWYHHLLNGSVYAGIDLEKELKKNNIHVKLGQHIKKESPINILGILPIHSDQKLTFFYIYMPLICFLTIKKFIEYDLFKSILYAFSYALIFSIILGFLRIIKDYKIKKSRLFGCLNKFLLKRKIYKMWLLFRQKGLKLINSVLNLVVIIFVIYYILH